MKDTEAEALELVRDYPVTPDRLWRAVTEPEQLLQWFGPEGVYIAECQMDFRTTGPWTCSMIGRESGTRFKVSGQVTKVAAPEDGQAEVGLTWAWHDDSDRRGPESHVIFRVQATETGARLILRHSGLASAEQADSHSKGWLSALRKMDIHLSSPGVQDA
ncbi:SRPBCC family protein [Pseudooceanicola algae]|uniref:Activator of Hsp90 ATPase homologue 1/2-like C-terminal domain-containing protein n=1 Tax=Pseudooceanicola algae TaxID=1537215 RepID=A0A418SBC9_9RHOB|nr:SRPBCC domain-containing protein [Pseudooceanicola algae]QPM91363.1 hypothetical protein PSAL_026160 [Pseudooceanicola algae]